MNSRLQHIPVMFAAACVLLHCLALCYGCCVISELSLGYFEVFTVFILWLSEYHYFLQLITVHKSCCHWKLPLL